ncbi:MAG: glycerol-3-phosphate acyltransferase [Oscillospiraceae bacterium]|nr:glycerol-3-phosphate acyltransferase [Oscillospiraceae bacterium]
MNYIPAIILGYLFGCSHMAYYLSKIKKVDLRSGGSGNLGGSNVTVLMGWKAGILTTVHDVAKAMIAVIIAKWLFPDTPHVGVVTGVAAVLGHIFPFYLKFNGGKGFACYIGMLIALNWKFAVAIIIASVVITIVTDYIVMATTTTIVVSPIFFAFTSWVVALIMLIATAVIIYKHRVNYVRIYKGTELGLRSAIRGDNRVR